MSLLGIKNFDISIVLADDDLIGSLNSRYLSHRCPTDVIAFCFGDGNTDSVLEGELYLGVEEITRNSFKYKTNFWWELCFCLAHGILHLLGYTDYDKDSQSYMYKEQLRILKQIGLADCGEKDGR